MTGYGKSEIQNDELILSLELRTINSRFLDFSPRLPRVLMPYEDDALKLIKKKCIRGRVTLSVKLDYITGNTNAISLNLTKLESYIQVIQEIQKIAKKDDMPTIGDILRLPDIFTIDNESEVKELKSIFMVALEGAIKETENIRLQEGNNIRTDLSQRLDQLIDIINKIKNISLERREENFQKYRKIIIDLMAEIDIDENRIYQEAAIMAEKKDLTEEIVRFNSHIDLFSQYMNSKENEGKKLNFLLQEMSREVNTIGSKTDFVQISHLVVQLKAELEKMREQVQNIV